MLSLHSCVCLYQRHQTKRALPFPATSSSGDAHHFSLTHSPHPQLRPLSHPPLQYPSTAPLVSATLPVPFRPQWSTKVTSISMCDHLFLKARMLFCIFFSITPSLCGPKGSVNTHCPHFTGIILSSCGSAVILILHVATLC